MRDWRVCRVWQPHPDGQRHWDRTYQQLMAWTLTGPRFAALPADPAPPAQEGNHEDRDLCTGVDPAPGPGERPRPATGASAGATGCQVHFLDRPMSQDPHDQLLLQIRGAMAEYERSLIAERMRRGRLRKLQAGVRQDEAEAAAVAEMFA